jgi:hypothetical protein
MRTEHTEYETVRPASVDAISSAPHAIRRRSSRRHNELTGDESVDTLLVLLESEAQKRKGRQRQAIAMLVLYLSLIAIMMATHNMQSIGAYTSLISSIGGLYAATQLQRKAVSALAKYDDIRAVGRLAEALEFQDKNVAAVAEPKLTELLPRLQPCDAGLLNDAQRRSLDRALLKHRKPELVIAILKALQQVGDAKSLEPVEKLAGGQGRTGRDGRVVNAAVDCVPALKLRAQAERDAQTLLRPVLSGDPEGTLLRPAHGPGTADPQVLLRPASNPDAKDTR